MFLEEGPMIDDLMVSLLPGGIEAQEAAGQRQLCAFKDRLPIRGTEDRSKWEAAGFVFGEPITESGRRSIFVACQYPAGWKLVPTGHSMWSELQDETGKKRAPVFFKAAFYDYNSHTFGLDGSDCQKD